MIDCECGAAFAPTVIIREDVGSRHRCPECERFLECCPNCFAWFLPFASWNHQSGCPDCRLDRDAKSALRLPNDHPCGRTLRELRADEAVPQFNALDGSEPSQEIEYHDGGEVSA